jgi:hypothetical protein
VFRRLRQDVPGFRGFLARTAESLGMTADLFGAKVVGRYRSGAPIVRTGNRPADDTALGGDDCRNNAFEFGGHGTGERGQFCPPEGQEEGEGGSSGKGGVYAAEHDQGRGQHGRPDQHDHSDHHDDHGHHEKHGRDEHRGHPHDRYRLDGHTHPEPADQGCQCPPEEDFPEDPDGLRCPFAGHIRKAYPRNDRGTLSPDICESTTQTHRIMRRGIPFGPPFPQDPPQGYEDTADRGLLFLCYQTSIVDQFEFVQTSWANNPDFKDRPEGRELRSGFDLVIGQNGGEGQNRERPFVVPLEDGRQAVVTAHADWVIPTGGEYFFSPSIPALHGLADGSIR